MTDAAFDLLSHEELDAVLETVSKRERATESATTRRTAADLRAATLARPLRDFAEEQSRLLSTLHQRAIEFSPMSTDAVSRVDFVGAMTSLDRVAILEFQPTGEIGAVLVGRSLLYGWLTMALGGPAGTPPAIPERDYSPIEQRFLRGIATELAKGLARSLSNLAPLELQVRGLLEPHLVPGAIAQRVCVTSFDAKGFGDVARLRIALPDSWVGRVQQPSGSDRARGQEELKGRLLEMPVTLRAEIGTAELPVPRVAALAPGDLIELDPVDGGDVLVHLEDRAKFHAVPGVVGGNLAIQLVKEVEERG